MVETLKIYRDTRLAGRLRQDDTGGLEFKYAAEWLSDTSAIPLSIRPGPGRVTRCTPA